MTEPQEPHSPSAAFHETFARELRTGARDAAQQTAVGFWHDLLFGVLVLVVFVVLVGGGAAVGAAFGRGAVVGALVGTGLFAVITVAFLATGAVRGVRTLRGTLRR